jgi:GTPase-associated protein 1
MTAPEAFGRLLYTDCLPGTGRGGGGGFQVQAKSADVDAGLSALAVGSLLYEVQVPWLSERRPVGEFPLGFAHAGGAGYGTAQGQYVGKAAAGGRDGNHVTDCLLTVDGDLYGMIRPAQLWRSGLWRSEPWPDRECPPLPAAELEAGPLTVDAIADWARARAERGPVLARLLTVLENPGGRRVVIVSDGPDEAMSWIAAATLLLPARRALDVSFKVFAAMPMRAGHRIAAAPAPLFPQVMPGRDGTALVLDAATSACDEGEVSERAAFFTGKLLADGDPYDVVDAVELAAALDGAGSGDSRLGGPDAVLTAWALTRPDEPVTDAPALSRWLAGASRDLLDEHGPAVTAMLLPTAPPAGALRWIDGAAADKRLAVDRAEVRVRLLTAELAEIRDGRPAVPLDEVLPAVALGPDAQRDAESELSSALLLGSDQEADLLLCLARRHQVAPDLTQPLAQRLHAFAAAWIDRPDGSHPAQWALRAEVLDSAHDQLRGRLMADGATAVAPAVRRLNLHFGDRADLGDPLDCHIQASLIAEGPRPGRLGRLRGLLSQVADLARSAADAASAAGARNASAALQRALVQWRAVDAEAAVTILTELPDSLPVLPEISEQAARQLANMSEKPTPELLDLLGRLDQSGKAPSTGRLGRLVKEDRLVRAFSQRALEDKTRTDQSYLEGTVALLRQADTAVIRARLDEVLTACLRARHPQLGALVLTELRSPIPRLLAERWGQTLGARDPVSDGLWCVHCLDYEFLPDAREDQLAGAVRAYARTLPTDEFDAWYGEVAQQAGPVKRELWKSIFSGEARLPRRNPRAHLWRNRDGGRP